MTFSKRAARVQAEGPSGLRRIRAFIRGLRAALRPRAKRPRPNRGFSRPSYTKRGMGRRHVYGPGTGAKLRTRVVRNVGTLQNPFCPTDDSTDSCWLNANANGMAIRERERANERRHS